MWVRKIENMPDYPQYKRGIEDPNRNTLKWIKDSEFKDNLSMLNNRSAVSLATAVRAEYAGIDVVPMIYARSAPRYRITLL